MLIRFSAGAGAHLGVYADGRFCNLTAADPLLFSDVPALLTAAAAAGATPAALVREALKTLAADAWQPAPADWRAFFDVAGEASAPPASGAATGKTGEARLLCPVEPPEVWAAGVTYERSRDARVEEARVKDIYARVYEAERPELFLKATGPRVMGPAQPVRLRSDSSWMVPEPELGLVLDASGQIVGLLIGNDVSARDIEGENPLYLPQAKIFAGSCALGPVWVFPDEVGDPYRLRIRCRIWRQGRCAFEGSVGTDRLKRTFTDLVRYLRRDNIVFPGTVLLTGTGIVPPDDFSLAPGDVIDIAIDGLGLLRNPVEAGV